MLNQLNSSGFKSSFNTIAKNFNNWRTTEALERKYVGATENLISNFATTALSGRTDDFDKIHKELTRSLTATLKSNPKEFAANTYNHWNRALAEHGIPLDSGNKGLLGMSKSALHVENVQRHAQNSKKLMYTTMASSAAIIGIPGLASTAMTVGVTKAMFRKTRNRWRGYEQETY